MTAIPQNNHYLICWCNKVHYFNGGIKVPLEVIVAPMIQNQRPLNWKSVSLHYWPAQSTLLIFRYLKPRGHIALRFAAFGSFHKMAPIIQQKGEGAAAVVLSPFSVQIKLLSL